MAEGGALCVLESAAFARRRGAKVYGELIGFGSASANPRTSSTMFL